jgi:hypothetical protein
MIATDKKKFFLGLLSLLLIVLACYRSAVFAFGYSDWNIDQGVSLLHISPVFRPFAKVGDYENTNSLTLTYIVTQSEGDILIDPRDKAREIGGPHAARVVIYEALKETFYKLHVKNGPAIESVVRKLYCLSEEVLGVKINIFDRVTGTLFKQYVISCK